MKKNYLKPEAEFISLAAAERILAPLDPDVGSGEQLPEGWE